MWHTSASDLNSGLQSAKHHPKQILTPIKVTSQNPQKKKSVLTDLKNDLNPQSFITLTTQACRVRTIRSPCKEEKRHVLFILSHIDYINIAG